MLDRDGHGVLLESAATILCLWQKVIKAVISNRPCQPNAASTKHWRVERAVAAYHWKLTPVFGSPHSGARLTAV